MPAIEALGKTIRNPLVVFGVILIAGDGPLAYAYINSQDPIQAWVALGALILFVFAMGGFFCYLVAFKPRHLYAPGEIPESAFGKSIFADADSGLNVKTELEKVAKQADEQVAKVKRETLAAVDGVSDIRRELPDLIERAISETRRAEKQAQTSKDLVRAKDWAMNLVAEFPACLDLAGLQEQGARRGGLDAEVVASAIVQLEVKGFLKQASCGTYEITPGAPVGRVAEREWRDDAWWYRLEGRTEWIREDKMRPV